MAMPEYARYQKLAEDRLQTLCETYLPEDSQVRWWGCLPLAAIDFCGCAQDCVLSKNRVFYFDLQSIITIFA